MKQLMITTALALSSLLSFAIGPIPRVLHVFNSTFPYAKEVRWNENNYRFEASFMLSDIRYDVVFDKGGNILSAMRYYGEQGLPILVRTGIEKRFAGMKVFGVTEVSNNQGVDYYVVLEDQKRWINVKADSNGTVRVESKYRKTEAPSAVAGKERLTAERQAYDGNASDGLY